MPGARAALTTAVDVRSYSPIMGVSPADVVTHASLRRDLMYAAEACSWRSSRKLLNKATATASMPSRSKSASAASMSPRTSGVCSLPSLSMRPRTPLRRWRGTSTGAYGLRWFHWSSRNPRLISRTSRKPSVVSRPTLAPLPSIMRLVATVEPCTKSAHLPSTSRTLHPSSRASRSSEATTPRLGSSGTDSTLTTTPAPALSVSTRSVNVPPTSIPRRQGATSDGRLVVVLPMANFRAAPSAPCWLPSIHQARIRDGT